MTDRELLQQVMELMEAAIKAGDWKVDGACDPDMLFNSIRTRLAQPEPEPVAWLCWEDKENNLLADTVLSDKACTECFPVYTAPPKKEWVGLTGEELQEIYQGGGTVHFKLAMAEEKLKEKNT